MPEDLFRAQVGDPHHHAYVVDDIEATVKRLVDQLGAGPFFLIENVPLENVLSRGEPAELVHNSAFGSCDEVVNVAPEHVECPRPMTSRASKAGPVPTPKTRIGSAGPFASASDVSCGPRDDRHDVSSNEWAIERKARVWSAGYGSSRRCRRAARTRRR